MELTPRSSSKKVLSFGDVHLGATSNPAPYIIENIRKYIHPVIAKGDIDLVVINGDLFDRLLFLNDPHVGAIDAWVIELVSLCALHKTELICMEGTPRHDRKQCKRLVDLAGLLGKHCKVEYIQQLSIRYVESIARYVLFVPDVIRDSAQTTYSDVLDMLEDLGLDHVDVAFIHGAFTHQLPVTDKHTHDPLAYEAIVKDVIVVNHVHQYSHVGKIVAPGSFDRTEHGHPGQHGAVLLNFSTSGVTVKRLINKTPLPYVDVDLSKGADAIEAEAVRVTKLAGGRIPNMRLIGQLSAENKAIYEAFKKKYPSIKWSIKGTVVPVGNKEDRLDTAVEIRAVIEITEDNIVSIVSDKLHRNGMDDITEHVELLRGYL